MSLAALPALAAAGPARAAEAAASPLEGAWHVLVHYRDAAGPDPEAWHWEDRVWDFRVEGERLVWTEYLLIEFSDESDRFVNLGTALAQRVPGAWEPSFRQRQEIENGLRVLARSARSQRLERDPEGGGWRSPAGAEALARLAEGSVFVSEWSIEGDPAQPVFAQRDELRSLDGAEPIGATVYATERREEREGPLVLRGRYERDATRRGRFRLVRARIARATEEAAPAGGRLRIGPREGIPPTGRLLFAWARPFHYFGTHVVRIETSPPGALLDLAYVRRGTQLDYARVHAPVEVELPPRIRAGPQDVLRVRALADGYERDSYAVAVRGGQERLAIELAPLRNALVLAGWRTLAGWSALELHTDVEPVLRMRRTREELTLVLAETALGEAARAALGGVHGALVESAEARQVGSDLVLRLALAESARTEGVPIRTFSGRDLARDRHVTLLDGSDPGNEASRAADVQAAIDGIGAERAGGCALAFDAALRARLDPAELQRAFANAPPFAQAVLRAALRRLGALAPDGRLRLRDGTRLDPARPLELELALERGAQVEGALAFLRALVDALEPPDQREPALRGFAAPAADPAEFARALEDARSAETRCRSG